jgi:glycosyltransferase involved in cell wall biosynthesis
MDTRCPQSVRGLDGYKAVEIFFRCGRDLLGRIRLPCPGDELDLKTIRSAMNRLPGCAPPLSPKGPLPKVTVAVCTHNRKNELKTTLGFLQQLKYPADEILVVDNACQEEIRQLVEQKFPGMRYLPEPRKGLNFARNRALVAAGNEIIAFLDDDTQPDALWVRCLAECFASYPNAGSVTGPVLPSELETEAQDMFEQNGGFCRGFTRRVLPWDRRRRFGFRLPLVAEATDAGTGCNMSFRTAILKAVGGFDPALDTGAPLPGGGDLEILYRIPRAGHELVYEPRVIISHRHRRDKSSLYRQLMGHQRAFIAFLVKVVKRDRGAYRLQALIFLQWRLLKANYRMLHQLVKPGPIPFRLHARLFVASLIGLGSYQASVRRNNSQS